MFPLAFPFIAGPGALATILLWFGPVRIDQQPLLFLGLLVGVVVVLVLTLIAMWLSSPLMRVLGVTGRVRVLKFDHSRRQWTEV